MAVGSGAKRISRVPAEVDDHYDVEVGIQADLCATLDALATATNGLGTMTSDARMECQVAGSKSRTFRTSRMDNRRWLTSSIIQHGEASLPSP